MVDNGEYYGYPKCCIKEFIKDLDKGLNLVNRKNRIKAGKNGFIPCRRHAALINNNKIKISSLITNRLCTTSFDNKDIRIENKSNNHKNIIKNIIDNKYDLRSNNNIKNNNYNLISKNKPNVKSIFQPRK